MEIDDVVNITQSNKKQLNEISFVDIYMQKRNGKKCWTIIKNLEVDDKKELLKVLRRKFSCNGNIDEDDYIWLTGDHREELEEILTKRYNFEKGTIKIH